MKRRTHYDVLGIPRFAGERQIREAYRKLAFEFHPDRNPSPEAAERFREITEAHEVLSDAERRREYDRWLAGEKSGSPRRPAARPTETRRVHPSPPTGSAHHRPPPRPPSGPSATKASMADILRLTQLLHRGRFAEAEALAMRLIRTFPGEAMPYAAIADVARFRGDFRRAAEYYAYAAQMNPGNPTYLRKYEEVLRAVSAAAPRERLERHAQRQGLVAVGGLIVLLACTYVAIADEPPFWTFFPLISSWTLGVTIMLFLSGVALGATLNAGRHVDPYYATFGSALSRVPPALGLALISIVNFWAACLFFLGISANQGSMNRSLGVMLLGTAGAVVVIAVGAYASGTVRPEQVLLWGGNLAYLGTVVGWLVSDAFRD